MTNRLAFIHIPKTGGSAFVGKIIGLWPSSEVTPYTGIGGFIADANLDRYNFVAGHTFYPKMKELLPEGFKYITILREPIQRICSHWIHLKKFNLIDVETFEQFIYGEKLKHLAKNLMAKHLAWWPEGVPTPASSGEIEMLPMPFTDDELYERAKANLERFWYVGYQDRWVEAVQKVYDLFGLPLPSDTIQRGAQDYRFLLSEKLLADLRRINGVDIKLYNQFK